MSGPRFAEAADERWTWGWGAPGPGMMVRYGRPRTRYPGHPGRHGRIVDGRHDGPGPLLPILLFAFLMASGASAAIMLFLFSVGLMVMFAVGAVTLGKLIAGWGDDAYALPRQAPPLGALGTTVGESLPAAPRANRYGLPGGALAARGGFDLYRRRLLDVLKERYVRGEITLEEFEHRAGQIVREPSARHLA